jgi:hypothetical protein
MFNRIIGNLIAPTIIATFCVSCASDGLLSRDYTPQGAEIEMDPVIRVGDDAFVSPGIQRFSIPDQGVGSKTIYISLENSPKITQILQADLRNRGFNITESDNGAEEVFVLQAGYEQNRPAARRFAIGKKDLGEALESSSEVTPPSDSEVSGTLVNISLGVLLGMSVFYSAADTLTKDMCFTNECQERKERRKKLAESNYSSTVSVQVKDGQGRLRWVAYGMSYGDKPSFGHLVQSVFEYALKPLYDLKPAPESQQDTADRQKTEPSSHEAVP